MGVDNYFHSAGDGIPQLLTKSNSIQTDTPPCEMTTEDTMNFR